MMTLTAVCVAMPAAWAADPDADTTLRDLRRQIEGDRARDAELERKALEIASELDDLRRRLVDAAAEERALETGLATTDAEIDALSQEERDRLARLEEQRRQLGYLLTVLQRMARLPPEAVVAAPQPPQDTLRAALLLRATIPGVEEQASALRRDLEALNIVRETLAARRRTAQQTLDTVREKQAEIAGLVERRATLLAETEAARRDLARRMERLAAEAEDVEALIARLQAERAMMETRRRAAEMARAVETARLAAERERTRDARAAPAPEPPAPQSPAAESAEARPVAAARPPAPRVEPLPGGDGLVMPAAGTIVLGYGERDKFGAASRGLTIKTRPGATIVAPRSGLIMFAGPFRGYGQILIVEHSDGYHSLIAGLGRIDTTVGQKVLTGEPIGVMDTGSDVDPDLYYELRRNGQPINPQRGLAANDGRGQG